MCLNHTWKRLNSLYSMPVRGVLVTTSVAPGKLKGLGQFRPNKGSQHYVGEQEKLETVAEYKVELVYEDEIIKAAVTALLDVHPYEEPAYSVWQLEDIFNS